MTLHHLATSELDVVSVWVDQALDKLCAQRLQEVPVGRVQHTFGGEKGSEVSLCRLFEDLLIKGEIRHCSLQPGVLFL
jgi:hypothetical protein